LQLLAVPGVTRVQEVPRKMWKIRGGGRGQWRFKCVIQSADKNSKHTENGTENNTTKWEENGISNTLEMEYQSKSQRTFKKLQHFNVLYFSEF